MVLLQRLFAFTSLLSILYSCTPDQDNPFTPTVKSVFHTHNFYKDGEKFKYKAQYGPLDVGQLEIVCDQNVYNVDSLPVYRISACGQLNGLIGTFSELDDKWETLVDTTSLLPFKFSRHLKENKYKKNEFCYFLRDKNLVKVKDTTPGEPRVEKEFPISASIEDMISSFYLLRNIKFYELKEGDTTTIDAFLENASYNVKIKYLGKEKVKTKFGKTKAIVIAPLIPGNNGVLAGGMPIKAWISDNDKKIPLQVHIKTSFGPVNVDLYSYSNKFGRDSLVLQ